VFINHNQELIGSHNLDHLGLVGSAMEKLKLIQTIDEKLPLCDRAKTTIGQRVAAIIFNGLGFMDTRLYLFSIFLEAKPVEKLFGADIQANSFNDDTLGRALDAISEYETTKFFSEIATKIALDNGLFGKSMNVDTTTLSLYGDYECAESLPEDKDSPKNGLHSSG
jgi:transposase